MLCKGCHYSLANLTEHRCPECGRDFDPADPKTFTRRSRLLRDLLEVAGFLGISLLVSFVLASVVGLVIWVFLGK